MASKRQKWKSLLKQQMVKNKVAFEPDTIDELLNSIDPPRYDFVALKPEYLDRLLDSKIAGLYTARRFK
jgi:hypothetical protein